jgi:hypothetical protein
VNFFQPILIFLALDSEEFRINFNNLGELLLGHLKISVRSCSGSWIGLADINFLQFKALVDSDSFSEIGLLEGLW